MTTRGELPRIGYLPFRDETVFQLIDGRNCVYGERVTDIASDLSEFESEDRGDLQFFHFWGPARTPKGARIIGSWAAATPAKINDIATAADPPQALPIQDESLAVDIRYDQDYTFDTSGGRLPKGAPGIVIAAAYEESETKLFFPASSPLVAHHSGLAPPTHSAQVWDIDNTGGMDQSRRAGLHSAWWVKQLPFFGVFPFGGINALALNLTQSAGDTTGHGLFVAPAETTPPRPISQGGSGTTLRRVVTPPRDAMAFLSHSMSGPLCPGFHGGDKHQIGVSSDGPFNSGHISVNAYFYADQIFDAPLSFERSLFPKVSDKGFPHLVHRVYDPDAVHPFIGGDRKGMWREYVNVPLFIWDRPPGDGNTPPTTPPDKPFDPFPPGGGNTPTPPVGPPGSGDLGGGNRGPVVFPIPPDDSNPVLPEELQPIGEGFKDTPDFQPGGSVRVPGIYETRTPYPNAGSHMKFQIPGLSLQAHPSKTVERYAKHTPNPPSDFVEKMQRDYPVVAQVEAFGHETAPGRFAQDSGSRRYTAGTGKGGLCLFPPQSGMTDADRGFTPPSGGTQSTVDFVMYREKVRLLFGTPSADIGEGVNGVGMFLNSSQNLQIGGVDELGASDESKFALFNMQVSVQGTGAPNLWVWNTDTTSSDEDSGYLLFAGRTSSSSRTMRLRMHHPTSGVQALGIYDGSTEQASLDEYGVLHLTPATEAQAATRASFGKFFANSDDSDLPYYRSPAGTLYNLTGGGDVSGPGSSTDSALVLFDGTTGKIIKGGSGITSPSSGQLFGVSSIDGGAGNLNLTANASGEVSINDAGEDLDFRIESDTKTHALFLRGSDGFLGVGESNPGAPLHVTGNDQPLMHWESTSSVVQHTHEFTDGTNQLFGFLKFSQDGSTLNSCKFELQSTLTANTRYWLTTYAYNSGSQNAVVFNESGDDIDFRVEGNGETHLLFIDAGNDRIGLGTSSPDERLHLANSSQVLMTWEWSGGVSGKTKGRIAYDDSTNITGGGWVFQDVTDAGAFTANQLTVVKSGANILGVGVTNPAYPCDVAGACHASSFPTSSSRLLKENDETIKGALSIVEKLRGVRFTWNQEYKDLGRYPGKMGRSTDREIGVIAEEIEQHLPELVTTWESYKMARGVEDKSSPKKQYKAVDYSRMVPVLIEAIKELSAKVTTLEAK